MIDESASLSQVDSLKLQLLTLAENSESSVLSCVVFNVGSRLLGMMFRKKKTPSIVAFVFLVVFLIILLLGIARLTGPLSLTVVAQVITASLCANIIFFTIKQLYPIIVPTIAKVVSETIHTADEVDLMFLWFKRTLNLAPQVALSLVLPFATLLILGGVDLVNPRVTVMPVTYLSLGVMFFAGANLLYWALTPPSYLKTLSHLQMRLFLFDPTQDESIRVLARLVMLMVILGGLIVLVFIAFSYFSYVAVYPVSVVLLIMLSWYALGIFAAVFLFGYSNYYLSHIIYLAKQRLLSDLRARIDSLYAEMGKGIAPEKLQAIEKALEFYKSIRDTPSSSINWQMFRALLSSILLQTAPFLLSAINWPALLKFLPSTLVKP